jgi:TetR/AcrR family transcriptional regulator, cholesterol catabolism regulator
VTVRRANAWSESRRTSARGPKKDQILAAATEYFGRHGYDETKWADVAAAVDIGSTALYHYFVSKQHCLYEIMGQALVEFGARFDRVVAAHDDWTDSLVAVLTDAFDLTDQEVLRNRVLVAQLGRLGTQRALPREEAARAAARARVRDLEFSWGTFLARGMQQRLLPESDPRLLTRAVLGLYTSVWHWYRPGEALALADVGRFVVSRQLAVLGCSPDLAADAFADARDAA